MSAPSPVPYPVHVPPVQLSDPEEIRRAVSLMCEPGEAVEMRCLRTKRGTVSGYYTDPNPLVRDAVAWSGQAASVYITLNRVLPDLLARACNQAEPYAINTTGDNEVTRRRWFLIDFDPIRPAGISASDSERAAAILRAGECRDFLSAMGFPLPIFADSGNGAHLLYRIDTPNDMAHRDILKGALAVLSARFTDEAVAVDQSTFNASRICKLYGTLSAKGHSVPELGRVHRIGRIIHAPEVVEVAHFAGGVA